MTTPDWQRRLETLIERHHVPGAVLGISDRGVRTVVAAGVAGLRNPAPVTPATAFQLGSISKVYTATLLLALAGPEILDASVADRVPEAAGWMDPSIRVGHLLTHSSGLGGDVFADTGRGDDALARYVTHLAGVPDDHPLPPGTRYSYGNSGYAVLGRLIEVLSATTYDDALRTHLLVPLGADATSTLPEETILRPVALGHNRDDEHPLTADDQWNFSRACAPLGGIAATADDVLAFAELHLADGHASAGATDVLPAATARLMRERHLETPPLARPGARGLGWGIFDGIDGSTVGHDGETLGQIAALRLSPAHRLAVVVLTNAIPDGDEVTAGLLSEVLTPLGLAPSTLEQPPPQPDFDPAPYLGTYRNRMATTTVTAAPGGLTLTVAYDSEGLDREVAVAHRVPLGPADPDAFVDGDTAAPTRADRFGDRDADGRTRSYYNGRIAWRV